MPTIETLLLCNHAEAQNGLLYIAGGGWTNQHRPAFPAGVPPPLSHFGIAVTIVVPWAEANRRYRLRLWVEPEDGGAPVIELYAEFEQGRPAGLPPGSDLRSVLAVNGDVQWPSAGGYRLEGEILGTDERRAVSFRVHDFAGGATPVA